MKILFVQSGDFREAHRRISATGEETYHAQKHSMDLVISLVRQGHETGVLSVADIPEYEECLDNDVMTYACPRYHAGKNNLDAVLKLITKIAPTHVVLRSPDAEILNHCLHNQIKVLPVFADAIVPRSGLRYFFDKCAHARLANLLNDPKILVVGNHNKAATETLAKIGVKRDKLVPWDWPRPHHPSEFPPRNAPINTPARFVFVGTLSEAKGTADVLRALTAQDAREYTATFVGGSRKPCAMEDLANTLGVADRVTFTGLVPFTEVLPLMLAHDVVIVPSRAEYQEGLPGVIYQALAARVPVLMSPHPVFKYYFVNGQDALFADSYSPADIAKGMKTLVSDTALYGAISKNSEDCFEKIALRTDWVDLVQHWCDGKDDDIAWLRARTLGALENRTKTAQHTR